MDKKAQLVNEDFLIAEGFKRDLTAPKGVNRWEKTDGRRDGIYMIGKTYLFSITLTSSGLSHTLYGVGRWNTDYDYQVEKRSFDNRALTIDDYEKFIDRCCVELPEYIKTTKL